MARLHEASISNSVAPELRAGGLVTGTDPIHMLRMAAIEERLGRTVGSDRLINAALNALLAGIDSPSLAQLAGLTRREEPDAHESFNQVIEELHLAPTLPDDRRAARWELVRWWCQLIADGQLPPEVGGRLIWLDGWNELDYPDALQPIVGAVVSWEDWTDDWEIPREAYRKSSYAPPERCSENLGLPEKQ